jgi:octaprenyl-diphosphate synthase
MSLLSAVRADPSRDVLRSLRSICDEQGLAELAARLADLGDLVRWDMKDFEGALNALPERSAEQNVVTGSALHLIARGGKRLRPMCVALAARVGDGFNDQAREMGVAVELVHCATLLHDDVIDESEQRRGAPAARMLYGNAASIFAGDWLLVEALRRVRVAGVEGTLDRLLAIIEEMIFAEALQLENRGKIDTRRESYFKVVEGKTAALFRWAMYAGGRAGGLDEATCKTLEDYGTHLGMAFQLIDDWLDYAGDEQATGKALFTDLREGKMTYPLLHAYEQDPTLGDLLGEILGADDSDPAGTAKLHDALKAALVRTGALDACRALALSHADRAAAVLSPLPDSRAIAALLTVAQATVHREA